jgi:hypothetical protein
MSGVTTSVGALGAASVLGHKAASGTLPFTGFALGAYLAFGIALVLAGVVFRVVGATQSN